MSFFVLTLTEESAVQSVKLKPRRKSAILWTEIFGSRMTLCDRSEAIVLMITSTMTQQRQLLKHEFFFTSNIAIDIEGHRFLD
jgi:hypothetical protein